MNCKNTRAYENIDNKTRVRKLSVNLDLIKMFISVLIQNSIGKICFNFEFATINPFIKIKELIMVAFIFDYTKTINSRLVNLSK